MKQLLFRIFLILFFLLLILNPQTTVSGASAGLLLWFHSIIPSLLPFMILSNLLVALNGISLFTNLFYPLTSRLFGISKNGSYALLAGLVCGYPMGAKDCADLLKEQKISKAEAQYLLCFTNNPGPAFLSGYILQTLLKNASPALPYFLSVYGAPLLFACVIHILQIFPKYTKISFFTKKEGAKPITPPFSPYVSSQELDFKLFDHAIMNGFETVTKLGGYIILFSILSAFIINLEFLDLKLKTLLLAITEITTGSQFISTASLYNATLKNAMLCACISFGGLSGIFQTKSVISDTSLNLLFYIGSKFFISLLSALLYLCFSTLIF